jgi:hypothetical protein
MAGTWTEGKPQNIMLATDLTPASDRAFDRAIQLATQWNAMKVSRHIIFGDPADRVIEHAGAIASDFLITGPAHRSKFSVRDCSAALRRAFCDILASRFSLCGDARKVRIIR